MEGRRRQKGENYRRSGQGRKPPRGSWKPAVPSWEKDFCKVVGSLDWETLLQMKKFTHLYSDVMNWNDSAGEESFYNAKRRYWAEINGLSCDIPLPDPDLYIDKINWDSDVAEPELLPEVESKPMIPNTGDGHGDDPVVIFGDSLLMNHAFLPAGWGDDEEVPFNHSSVNYGPGDALMANQAFQPTGWGDCEEKLEVVPVNHPPATYSDPWEQNWGNGAGPVWAGYSDNTWQFSGPAGYVSWAGNWNDEWGWSYANNDCNYIGSNANDKRVDYHGFWNDGSNITTGNSGYESGHNNRRRVQGKGRHRNHTSRNDKRSVPRKWNSINSCGGVRHNAAITVGRTWNQ